VRSRRTPAWTGRCPWQSLAVVARAVTTLVHGTV